MRIGAAKKDGIRAAGVTAIIPTHNRPSQLLASIEAIVSCEPPPSELIVYVDAGDTKTRTVLAAAFPAVRVLSSEVRLGPGGGRNQLVTVANYPVIASFDDDSYPFDSDYFARVETMFRDSPRAAVLSAEVFHEGEAIPRRCPESMRVADFIGCGCAYRKDAFESIGGYVPLQIAYGMEETDLAFRIHDRGWWIVKSRELRVKHDTGLEHHNTAAVTAASIANAALLVFLRYPMRCWWIGIGQVASRVLWLVEHGRMEGIAQGLLSIPKHLWTNRQYRSNVAAATVRSYLALRREPIPLISAVQVSHKLRAMC